MPTHEPFPLASDAPPAQPSDLDANQDGGPFPLASDFPGQPPVRVRPLDEDPFPLTRRLVPVASPLDVALAAMSALTPDQQATVLAQLGLAACPA